MSKPTLQDVADACGSHRNTVSEILRGKYDGDPETISKVQAAAKDLGYSITAPAKEAEYPEGVTVEPAEVPMTASHKFTIRYSIKVACDWEYDQDDKGNRIDETEKVAGTEVQNFSQCLSAIPTRREVDLIISAKRAELPDAV